MRDFRGGGATFFGAGFVFRVRSVLMIGRMPSRIKDVIECPEGEGTCMWFRVYVAAAASRGLG